MLTTARRQAAAVLMQRVELSGWDLHEEFFVEKAEVDWPSASRGWVRLRHAVPIGRMIFLRALDAGGAVASLPIAYHVRQLHVAVSGFRAELERAGNSGKEN